MTKKKSWEVSIDQMLSKDTPIVLKYKIATGWKKHIVECHAFEIDEIGCLYIMNENEQGGYTTVAVYKNWDYMEKM